MHNERRVHLIDTPGFDDTYRTDSDVLQDLAYWLIKSYKDQNIKLTGIVYLHRITDPRMTGNALKNLRTFQKLCGKKSMSSVVLVTTMWEHVNPADGDIREADLQNTAEFWGDMIRENSTTMRHLNNHHSAMNIIAYLIQKRTTTVLEIQTEMVDLKRPLDETEAGREVEGELIKQRQIFEQRLQRAQDEMKEALRVNDQKHVEELGKDQERLQKMIKDSEKGREDLRINLENLIKEKDLQHQRDKEAFDAKFKQQEAEMKRKEDEFKAWQAEKEKEEEQREKKRAATEAELKAAHERIEEGDEVTAAWVVAAVRALQEQQEHADQEKEQIKRESAERERRIAREREELEWMRERNARKAAYQKAFRREQRQQQQQQQQYYYLQQQQQQQQLNRMRAGATLGGAAGLGITAAAALPFMCNVM
jgi:hypothetical protein